MEWAQVWTIIGVLGSLFVAFSGFIIWVINKLDTDVKSLGNRLDGHAQRIDQLYKMFIDLLKEKK